MAGLFVENKGDGKIDLSCLVLNYGNRTLETKKICSFTKDVPDRPIFVRSDQIAGMSDFGDAKFDYDDYMDNADYINFGMHGRMKIEFGHGLDCVKMFNAFPVGAVIESAGKFSDGEILEDNELFEKIYNRDLEVAKAKDKYANDLMISSKELLMGVRKAMSSYSELLQQEYVARKKFIKYSRYMDSKFFKTSSMEKEKRKLWRDVDAKCAERRNSGAALTNLMQKVHESYFAYDMLARSGCGKYSEMMGKVAADFKNLIVLDVVRKHALGKEVPGGPKIMVAVEAARNAGKHCRRLDSFVSYSSKHFLGYHVPYINRLGKNSSSVKIIAEKRRRYNDLFKVIGFSKYGNIDNSVHPSIFYRAEYVYLIKLLNQHKIDTFDDITVVQRMMRAGYKDKDIENALKSCSVALTGRPVSEIISMVANCRIRYNERLKNNAKAVVSKKKLVENIKGKSDESRS